MTEKKRGRGRRKKKEYKKATIFGQRFWQKETKEVKYQPSI